MVCLRNISIIILHKVDNDDDDDNNNNNNGCETWSLTLREERRLRVFENRVLRRVFGHKRDEVKGNGENYIMSLGIFTPYPILCGW